MKYKTQQKIGIGIMIIAIIIEIYNLLFIQMEYWDLGVLMFLIGIIINDLAISKQIKKYEAKYGEI